MVRKNSVARLHVKVVHTSCLSRRATATKLTLLAYSNLATETVFSQGDEFVNRRLLAVFLVS